MPDEQSTVLEVPIGETLRPEAMEHWNSFRTQLDAEGAPPPPPPPAADPNAGKETPAPSSSPADEKEKAATPPTAAPAGVLPPESDTGLEPSKSDSGKVTPSKELFSDEAIASVKGKGAQANLAHWRVEYEKLEALAADLQKKVGEQPKPDDVAQARISELESRNTQLMSIVERKAVEEIPWFQDTFERPRAKAMESAQSIIKQSEIDPSALKRVLGLTGPERIEALDELTESIKSPTLRDRFGKAMLEIESLDEGRAAFLADREGNVQRIQQQEKVRQHQQFESQAKRISGIGKEIIRFMAEDRKDPFFQRSKAPGSEQWNENFDKFEQEADQLLTKGTDEVEIYSNMILGKRYPALHNAYVAEKQLRLAAERALNDRRGAEPGLVEGSGGSVIPGGEEIPVKADDFDPDSIRARLHRYRTG